MLPALFPEITHFKKRAFLSALAITGRVQEAARLIAHVDKGFGEVDDRIHYVWMVKDPEYASAVKKARSIAASRIEDTLYKLGVEGFDRPVIHQGEITTTYKEHNISALIFLLKGYEAKFKDIRRGQDPGEDSPPSIQFIQFNQVNITSQGSPDQGAIPVSSEELSAPVLEQDVDKGDQESGESVAPAFWQGQDGPELHDKPDVSRESRADRDVLPSISDVRSGQKDHMGRDRRSGDEGNGPLPRVHGSVKKRD